MGAIRLIYLGDVMGVGGLVRCVFAKFRACLVCDVGRHA